MRRLVATVVCIVLLGAIGVTQSVFAAGPASAFAPSEADAATPVHPNLPLWTTPSIWSPVLTTLNPGKGVQVLQETATFWLVRTAEGREGWVLAHYMQRATPPPAAAALAAAAPSLNVNPDPALLLPAGTIVPKLPAQRPTTIPAAGKQVRVHTGGTVWHGRNSPLFDRWDQAYAGEQMAFLDSAEGWLRVKTPRGVRGWIRGEQATLVEGDVTYSVRDKEWTLAYKAGQPEAVRLSLQSPADGVLRWTVEAAGGISGAPVAVGGSLRVPVAGGGPAQRVLPVQAAGVASLALSAAGAELVMASLPGWQVLEQSAGRLVLELRPRLTGVAVEISSDRTIYHFAVQGPTTPRASVHGENLVVSIPGAVLAANPLPAGLTVAAAGQGLQAAISTRQAFVLKRTEVGFALHLFKPGLTGKIIMLDPGHGGVDPGAANAAAGVVEKHANLRISEQLRQLLVAKGAQVLMTRNQDSEAVPPEGYAMRRPDDELKYVDLGHRTYMANHLRVDLFLSIHHNANSAMVGRGAETYYTPTTLNGPLSRDLARLIQDELPRAGGLPDRGAKEEVFYVTRNTDAPSALVEVAFVDNPVDAALINSPAFRERAAMAMVQALERFFAER